MNFSKNIGYHTRLYKDNTVKVTGGSFGGELSMDTANRLVSAHKFTVIVKPSGTPVFVDAKGREVRLYISVDASETDAGKAAIKEWRAEKAKLEEENERRAEREAEELDDLMNGLSHHEIVRRLRGG